VIGPLPSDRETSDAANFYENSYQHKIGLDHFGIRVKDLPAAVEELREQGCRSWQNQLRDRLESATPSSLPQMA